MGTALGMDKSPWIIRNAKLESIFLVDGTLPDHMECLVSTECWARWLLPIDLVKLKGTLPGWGASGGTLPIHVVAQAMPGHLWSILGNNIDAWLSPQTGNPRLAHTSAQILPPPDNASLTSLVVTTTEWEWELPNLILAGKPLYPPMY